jgi:hypothetical protein
VSYGEAEEKARGIGAAAVVELSALNGHGFELLIGELTNMAARILFAQKESAEAAAPGPGSAVAVKASHAILSVPRPLAPRVGARSTSESSD